MERFVLDKGMAKAVQAKSLGCVDVAIKRKTDYIFQLYKQDAIETYPHSPDQGSVASWWAF